MIRALTIIVCWFSASLIAKPSRFNAKALPQLLEFTGSRCAYQVEVENIAAGKSRDYAFLVKGRQIKAWGEQSQVEYSRDKFRVVNTTNIKANLVPSHAGGDYYRDAISVEKLNRGETYLFLCNGEVFEAILNTPENIYKIELLLKFNWEKQYPRKASIQQLAKDLQDPDLYVLAYNELVRRKRMDNDNAILLESLKGITGVRLLRLHLVSLGRRGPVKFEPQAERVQLRSFKQINFVDQVFDQAVADELLALELDRLITAPSFYTVLNPEKVSLFRKNLNRLRKDMREYGELYYELLAKFVKALDIKGNRSFAAEFMDDFRVLTLAAKAELRVPRTYVRLLEEKDAKLFLGQLLSSLNQMLGDERFREKSAYVTAILAKEIPQHPSVAYLPLLEQFDPYRLHPIVQSDDQLREEFRYKVVEETKEDLKELFLGASMVLDSLTSILEAEPRAAERVHKIGARFIAPGREIMRYLPRELILRYVAAYNNSKNLITQEKSGSRR